MSHKIAHFAAKIRGSKEGILENILSDPEAQKREQKQRGHGCQAQKIRVRRQLHQHFVASYQNPYHTISCQPDHYAEWHVEVVQRLEKRPVSSRAHRSSKKGARGLDGGEVGRVPAGRVVVVQR